MTHICVSKLTIIGSDNGLSPERRQAIIWTNAGLLSIWPLGTNFSEILSEIHTFSFKKMHFITSSEKLRPFCLGLNVLNITDGCTYGVTTVWWSVCRHNIDKTWIKIYTPQVLILELYTSLWQVIHSSFVPYPFVVNIKIKNQSYLIIVTVLH